MDLTSLNDGLLAPIVELSLTQGGQPRTMLEIIRNASGIPGLNRTDLRFGVGPDDEIYIVNKRDGVVRRIASVSGLLSCDFDDDDVCHVDDIDELGVEIIAGTNDPTFDLTDDGLVNNADRDEWLASAAMENGWSSPYKLGDTNLDGMVDGTDFQTWNAGKFQLATSGHPWTSGDVDFNNFVDGQDFLLWNQNKFTSSDDVTAVPEPATGWLFLGALILLGRRR